MLNNPASSDPPPGGSSFVPPRWKAVLVLFGALTLTVLLAFLGTISAQSRVPVGGVPLPLLVLVAIITLACFWLSLRLLGAPRWVVFLCGAAQVVAVLWLAPPGAEFPLLPGGFTSQIWLTVPPLLCALVLMLPQHLFAGVASKNLAAESSGKSIFRGHL